MYKNLDQSQHQIRLLRLLPGRDPDKVHCELFTVSLDESNEFEALSYVWGSEENPLQISVSGQTKCVTKSLESALHHLRDEENERILWVDSICINQDDNDERSSQVQLMQRIYSGACQVVVWLGPSRESDKDIIKVIKKLACDLRLHWTAIPDMKDKLLPLYAFLRHEWWSRVWTVQEAILAKQIIYHRGKIRLSGHDLSNVAASYKKHIYANRCCDALKVSDGAIHVVPDVTTVMDNVLQLRQFQLRIRNANFDEVALLFRHRKATNPLDKVYGLLGISCGIKKSSIDYTFSKARVYELATRDSLSHNNNLNILSHIFPKRLHYPDLFVHWPKDQPSWVPDWTVPDTGAGSVLTPMRYRVSFLDHYNACGPLTYKSANDDPFGKLRLPGVWCDTIEAVSDSAREPNSESEINTLRAWRNMAGMETAPGKAYVGGDTVSEAFWRTLCLDIHTRAGQNEGEARLIKRAGAEERGLHLVYWYVWLSKAAGARPPARRDFMMRVHDFGDHVSRAITQRRFCISRKGYIGLAPLGVEVGDHICVLAGGRVPFIVRDVQKSDGQDTSRFVCRLLGDSYFHGLMDGEAMRLVDDDKLQVEDFEII